MAHQAAAERTWSFLPRPGASITGAEAAGAVVRLLGLNQPPAASGPFPDVPATDLQARIIAAVAWELHWQGVNSSGPGRTHRCPLGPLADPGPGCPARRCLLLCTGPRTGNRRTGSGGRPAG